MCGRVMRLPHNHGRTIHYCTWRLQCAFLGQGERPSRCGWMILKTIMEVNAFSGSLEFHFQLNWAFVSQVNHSLQITPMVVVLLWEDCCYCCSAVSQGMWVYCVIKVSAALNWLSLRLLITLQVLMEQLIPNVTPRNVLQGGDVDEGYRSTDYMTKDLKRQE